MDDLPDALRAWFPESEPPTTDAGHLVAGGAADTQEGDHRAPTAPDFGDEPAAQPWRFKRPLLVIGVTAVALWTAVLVVGTTLGSAGGAEDGAGAGEGGIPATEAARQVVATADAEPGAGNARAASGSAGAGPVPIDVPSPVTATAVVALHETVTDDRRWVDAAAVDDVHTMAIPHDATLPDTLAPAVRAGADGRTAVVVVALQATLLEGDGRSWDSRRRARYALPLSCSPRGCRELAHPWPVPVEPPTLGRDQEVPPPSAPDGSRPPPASDSGSEGHARNASGGARAAAVPEGTDEEPYVAGLAAAGYRGIDVRGVRPLWPGVVAVQVEATPPGESSRRDLVVWMDHGEVDRPGTAGDDGSATPSSRLLGTPAGPATSPSAPVP